MKPINSLNEQKINRYDVTVELVERGSLMLKDTQGKELLEITRKNIEKYLEEGQTLSEEEAKSQVSEETKEKLEKERGVFVTLKTEQGELRGRIGKPYPEQTLIEGILDASSSAANDPRFPPVSKRELEDIEIELTVLTEPGRVEVNDLKQAEERIEIGEHGLIAKCGPTQGLLLPQVPEEHNLDLEKFLDHTCRKAGLSPGSWKEKDVQLFRFKGKIFKES